MTQIITRRSALIGSLATLFSAPAIVRASSLMPVSVRAVQADYSPVLLTKELLNRVEDEFMKSLQHYKGDQWCTFQIEAMRRRLPAIPLTTA